MADTNKLNQFKEIHKQEEALYAERNEKYGDSFSKTFQEYGPKASLIRLDDKLNRVKALISQGLDGSDGESLIDTLKDLSNYANMIIMELGNTPVEEETTPKKPSNKKKKGKKKEPTTDQEMEETPKEKGPLDDLTKKELAEVISQLGGTIPKKANREKLTSIINEFPKAKVAVAITSLKSTEADSEEDEDGEEE